MKVVLLAGGFGTRISEESYLRPKPMIEIGDRPMLWHIMKIYSSFGFNDFVVCLGYKGYVIKEYFANYMMHSSDFTIDFRNNGNMKIYNSKSEPWRVTLVDTGLNTMTGGRIRRIKPYVDNEAFMLTYGDGLSNIDIKSLLDVHKAHGKLATVTAVQPSGRFGALDLADSGRVSAFCEKPQGDGAWINGGYFVLEPGIFEYLDTDQDVWERTPLEKLANDNQLYAHRHMGFWQPMDTMRDKQELETMWASGKAPWKAWGE